MENKLISENIVDGWRIYIKKEIEGYTLWIENLSTKTNIFPYKGIKTGRISGQKPFYFTSYRVSPHETAYSKRLPESLYSTGLTFIEYIAEEGKNK